MSEIKRLALALTLSLGALAALAPGAWASITVTSNGDAIVNDSFCNLREAITAANTDTDANGCTGAATGPDTLVFDSSVRDTTILTTGEPTVIDELAIDAGCPSPPTPCVGLDVSGSADALTTDGTTPLSVKGLAITNANTGIRSLGGTVTAQGNWFGIKLDQSVQENAVGVEGRDDAYIGGGVPAERNVFAANNDNTNTGAGVLLFGADSAQVYGNYFGVNPSGALATGMENDDNIRVMDNGGDDATNIVIGGSEVGAPSVCDDNCNVIANADGDGIDIQGSGLVEVQGNHIGLSPNGSTHFPNDETGVANNSGDLQLGGSAPLDRNYIAGHETAVFSGSAPATLFAANNFIGTNSAGTALLPAAPSDTSRSLVSESPLSQIEDNRIGGSFVALGGNSTDFFGNTVGVGVGGQDLGMDGYAVVVAGDLVDFGGADPGEGNVVGFQKGAQFAAIGLLGGAIEAQAAAIMGNYIGTNASGAFYPNEGAGIEVGFPAPDATSDAVIGGCPACANVISNSGTDAVRIETDGSDENRITYNTGRNNGRLDVHGPSNDLFIDLGTNGQGNGASGPNEGIEAPTIGPGFTLSAATTTQLSGTSSAPNGTDIDVYTTYTRFADVKAWVAEGEVQNGAWSVTYPSALPAGTCITAGQSDPNNNSSELAPPVAIGGEGGLCDRIAPTTRITRARKRVGPGGGGILKLRFRSNEKAAKFQCQRQRGKFRKCRSPKTFRRLVSGRCTRVRVRAVDEAGNLDRSPAKVRFCVPD